MCIHVHLGLLIENDGKSNVADCQEEDFHLTVTPATE